MLIFTSVDTFLTYSTDLLIQILYTAANCFLTKGGKGTTVPLFLSPSPPPENVLPHIFYIIFAPTNSTYIGNFENKKRKKESSEPLNNFNAA